MEKKELTYQEKVYKLGETSAALISLWYEKPEEITRDRVFKLIADKYEDLGMDLEEWEKE